MTVMNRAQFKKQLQLGLNAVFGLEYGERPPEYPEIFEQVTSIKAYEEDVLESGLIAAPVKQEGAGVAYDGGSEVYTSRYFHDTIALAFAITEEAAEDNLYAQQGAKYAKALARSMRHTKEVKGAKVLNNAFDSTNFPGADGVSLMSTAHPLSGGGTSANRASTDAQLAEASLEEMLILMSEITDEKGLKIPLTAKKLIIPPGLRFIAPRLLLSPYRTGTSDNDINVINHDDLIGGGYAVNHYIVDDDNWYIVTDCPDGLKQFQRVPLQRGMEGDFETGNLRYKARERYSFGYSDWRGAFGSNAGT